MKDNLPKDIARCSTSSCRLSNQCLRYIDIKDDCFYYFCHFEADSNEKKCGSSILIEISK